MSFVQTYGYDHKGNMTEVTSYGSDGAVLGRSVFVYNEASDWIKKTTENVISHSDKTSLEPTEAEYRTIEYYK